MLSIDYWFNTISAGIHRTGLKNILSFDNSEVDRLHGASMGGRSWTAHLGFSPVDLGRLVRAPAHTARALPAAVERNGDVLRQRQICQLTDDFSSPAIDRTTSLTVV